MRNKAGKILSIIGLTALFLIAVFLVSIKLLGGGVYTVLSGSMEPTYSTGSLILVKSVDYTQLEVGDPITYALSEDLIATHRIVEISTQADTSDTWFYTKGDANETRDAEPVHNKNIIGMPVISIPYLGYLIMFLQSMPGRIITVGAIIVLIILGIAPAFKAKRLSNADFSGGMKA